MMKDLRHRYCIVGVGNTAYGQTPGYSQLALNVMAIRAALEDAGLTTRDLDGVLTKAPTSTFPKLWAAVVAEALRVKPNIVGTLDQAGATNIGLIQYAISCIELGQGEVVAIAYGDNPRTGTRATYARARGGDGAVAGLFGAPSSYAMAAQRRMHEYGTTKEQLGHVAMTHRHHASMNSSTEDVDFCEIYDCFTIVPIITLEEYGFAPRGKGGELYQDGKTRLGGELPCNTSGGLLSETGMPGTQLVCEAVRQLRGECGARQVKNAQVGLVSQQGGVLTTHATMLLSLDGR